MAGKSFKGNLEVLNLSDIFQSLAMNRHSGTLIVNDGKREKKIFFAEGEITLLSTSKRMRLGDLLIAGSKITEEDLDLALKLQKQSRKKLGEILIEEGFCEEDEISRLLRVQVEDELYDLFLWRKAEFEFLADTMPDDMAAESPNLTRLSINTNSLIMEALRRLDEWSLIQNLVPSTKEVFMVIDVDKFADTEVPNQIKSDPEVIDAKTSVEGLAEKFLISEFDLCQHLAELVKSGAIQALTQEQLAERAEAAYALNDFSGSAALYGRLAEYYPGESKIMVPLADSLRRSGAEKLALGLYEELASRLESEGSDPDRLRQCYEAITQLDPTRLDLARKLENIELEMANAPGAKSIVIPLVAVLMLVVGGGGVFAFRDSIFPKKGSNVSSNAAKLLEKAIRAEEKGKLAEAHGYYVDIWTDHQQSKEYRKIQLPIVVTTVPPGYDVHVNGEYRGSTSIKKPTLNCWYTPATKVTVDIYSPEGKSRGESPLDARVFNDPKVFQQPKFVIFKRPVGSIIGEGWLEAAVLYDEGVGAYLLPSRSGFLRVLKNEGGMLLTEPTYDKKVQLGERGDIFTDPVIVDEVFYVGTTDQGVLAVPLKGGRLPDQPKAIFPADYQVTGEPLVLPAKDPFAKGRVVFGTVAGRIYAYPLAGGAPIWEAGVDGATLGAPLHFVGGPSGDMCVFSNAAARVDAFSMLDGKALWTFISDVPVVAPPKAFAGEILVSLAKGRLVALDPQTGALTRTVYEEPKGREISILCPDSGDVIYVATDACVVRAIKKDGTAAWEFVRPGSYTPPMALQGSNLLIAADQARVFAVLPESGMVVWQAAFPDKGEPISRLSVNGDVFFVGTNQSYLHCCKISK